MVGTAWLRCPLISRTIMATETVLVTQPLNAAAPRMV